MSRNNSNETENSNETDHGNKEFLSGFGKFLGIFADFWSFTDNMLSSKLIKIYSIFLDSFLLNSFALLTKFPLDSI